MKADSYFRKILRVILGLTIYSFGVYLTIHASIGIAPWDVLGMGIAGHTPLNYGLSITMVNIVILGFDILMKEPVGIGMLIDALYTGNMIQCFTDLNPVPAPASGLFVSLLYLIGGILISCYGQYFYMSAGLTCGPRDTFIVGVGKFFRKIPIGYVHNSVLMVALLIGFLLGGPVGIGTVVVVVTYGLWMNLVYGIVKFEPRNVKHENLIETFKTLKAK